MLPAALLDMVVVVTLVHMYLVYRTAHGWLTISRNPKAGSYLESNRANVSFSHGWQDDSRFISEVEDLASQGN